MMPKIYDAIEELIGRGVPPQYLADVLLQTGWPPVLVNQAITEWLKAHGRLHQKIDFKIWLKKYNKKALPAIIVMVVINTINSSIMLLKPWPTKLLVDSGFGNVPAPGFLAQYTHKPALILFTSLMTILIFLLSVVVGTFKDYLLLRIGFWLNREIKAESFRHILHLPLYHQERLAKGDYIYRQNTVTNSLSDLVLSTTSSIIESIIMIIGVLVIMSQFSVKLTFISVIMIPFLFIIIKVLGPRLGKIGRALTELASNTSSAITESIDNAETVQAYTLEEKQLKHVDRLWQENYRLSNKLMFWGRLFRSTNSLLVILGTSLVMYFGGTAALNHQITVGELLIFMTYMGFLLGPVENLASQIGSRNQKLIDVNRIYEVLNDHPGIEFLRRENHFHMQHGKIEFQNVSYSYNNTQVLKKVNLTIQPGEKVAIIGPSGAGKTTILKLLPLFIEPDGGRITVDNIDIQTVSQQELRQKIAWISQAPQLFSDSIYNNLLDANIDGDIDLGIMDMALEVSNVNEFITKLPLGVQSPAGEGGSSLSGGQKQRIAIARGLMKNAPIICMDEPTAALDSKSENFIKDSLAKAIEGKTVVMVTHRKPLLALMDTIYVLEDGNLKNVKEHGGLTTYLKKIEGVLEKEAEQDRINNDMVLKNLERYRQKIAQQTEAAAAAVIVPTSLDPELAPDDGTGTLIIRH
jgi:ATP-binding cassette subfamily B protein